MLQKQSQASRNDDTTARVAASSPVMSVSEVKMHYFGPSLKLDASVDFDTRGDMVTVEQQPAGCGTHIVFKDYVKRGSKFTVLTILFKCTSRVNSSHVMQYRE